MTQDYATQDSWLRPVGRGDLVDSVADEFERPAISWTARFTVGRVPAQPDIAVAEAA